ncbi:MAG TPA: TAXI family TRAP transporter solute-binding subunit [Firmicutes bacterium]|nr:TAXI family TRAP transporter solute-binding subunit [Bacillota bacterium]
MKSLRILWVAVLAVILVCPAVMSAQTWNFAIGTSTLGGTYYIFGTPWAKVITDKVPNAIATVQSTNGPSANIQLMEKGELKLAYASAPAAYEGWTGTGWAKGRKYQRQRSLFTTYSSYFEIVTLSKSPIKTIRDLEGKRVHMSMPGGTPDIAMRYSLETLGIKPKEEVYMQTGNAADLLKDGRLDVVIAVMGLPTSFILDLQSTHDIRLVDIDPEDQTTVAEKYPYFAKGTIPKNTYKNQSTDINSFVFWNYAIGDKDLPEELVYNMVKAVFENKAEFEAAHSSGKELAPENIVYSVVPLHPGALRYYREIGIEIPDALIPPEAK